MKMRSVLSNRSSTRITNFVLLLGTTMVFLLKPVPVLAQAPPEIDPTLIEDLFERFIKLSFPIAIIVATIMIIVGGYMWMISAGDPQKVKTAQGTLTWGIIGLIFLGILGLLIEVVFDIFLP